MANYGSFESKLEKTGTILDSILHAPPPKISLTIKKDGSIVFADGKKYVPSTTSKKFHDAPPELINKCLIGPVGCGKTVAMVMECIMYACMFPECTDGVYRSRGKIIRNTYEQLKTTIVKTLDAWMLSLDIEPVKKTDQPIRRYYSFFCAIEGVTDCRQVYIELEGLALDHVGNIQERIKSLEVTYFLFNEAGEQEEEIFDWCRDRIGRYPAKIDRADPDIVLKRMLLDTNAPPKGHWIEILFEENKEDYQEIYHYPPAVLQKDNGEYYVNPKAENLEFLEKGYYEGLLKNREKSYIHVMLEGKYGLLTRGVVVYESFNADIHSVSELSFDFNHPIYIGLDFGLTPAALFDQFINGKRVSIKEFTTVRASLKEFLDDRVIPYLNTTLSHIPRNKFIVTFDPSGVDKSDGEGRDKFKILRDCGFNAKPARTNSIIMRLDSVKGFLNKMVGGQPGYLVSENGCPVLYNGYVQDYNYPSTKTEGVMGIKETPSKLHPWSDIHDAGQYNCLTATGTQTVQKTNSGNNRNVVTSAWV